LQHSASTPSTPQRKYSTSSGPAASRLPSRSATKNRNSVAGKPLAKLLMKKAARSRLNGRLETMPLRPSRQSRALRDRSTGSGVLQMAMAAKTGSPMPISQAIAASPARASPPRCWIKAGISKASNVPRTVALSRKAATRVRPA